MAWSLAKKRRYNRIYMAKLRKSGVGTRWQQIVEQYLGKHQVSKRCA